MPIDINDFREWKGGDIAKIKESQRRRAIGDDERIAKAVGLVDEIVALDEQWRTKRGDIDKMNKAKGAASRFVGSIMKKHRGKCPPELKDEVEKKKLESKQMDQKIQEEQELMKDLWTEIEKKLRKVGNYVPDDVPVHHDEEFNGKDQRPHWGLENRRTNDGSLRHHHELLWMIGGYEPDRGVKVAGHRAYFLTGPAVRLNLALQLYGLDYLQNYQYKEVYPPFFMKQDVMAKTAQLEEFDEALYKVTGGAENEERDKYLIATSEQPISAMHQNEWLQDGDLPIRYAGVSTCFRKEAGSSGKDVWGIFRVHQFEKIEQFVVCDPESSWQMHEEMIEIAEEFYKTLNLPYEVVTIVSGELNNAAAKKYDLEGWFPTLGTFRELVSCSNCTDYQSRAMETRYGQASERGAAKQYVHMLNATLCATTRVICCILENYQDDDGIHVPKVLQTYMGGCEFIPFIRPPPQVSETHNKKVKPQRKKGGGKKKGGKKGNSPKPKK